LRLEGNKESVKSKNKNNYNNLNGSYKHEGFDLKEAIKKRFFTIDSNNKIYFRGNVLIPIENTLFHLLSNAQLLTERISFISYNFFRKIVDKTSPRESKLMLLKNILQITGWGTVSTIMKRKKNFNYYQ